MEISGVPDDISNDKLEETAINILSCAEVNVDSRDVEACHRIGKKNDSNSTKVIIRMVNRKNCEQALLHRKKLRSLKPSSIGLPDNCKLFINENLTSYNNALSYKCRQLKRAGHLKRTYTRDGVVLIRVKEDGRAIKILHETKLKELFPNFNFGNDEEDDNDYFVDAPSDTSVHSSY